MAISTVTWNFIENRLDDYQFDKYWNDFSLKIDFFCSWIKITFRSLHLRPNLKAKPKTINLLVWGSRPGPKKDPLWKFSCSPWEEARGLFLSWSWWDASVHIILQRHILAASYCDTVRYITIVFNALFDYLFYIAAALAARGYFRFVCSSW